MSNCQCIYGFSTTDVGLNVEVIVKIDSCVDVWIGNNRAIQFIDIAELGEKAASVDTCKDRVRLLTKVHNYKL